VAVSRGTRAWLLWTSALLSLIALAWMGAVLVVHVQVGREIAELKRTYLADPNSTGQDVFVRWSPEHRSAFERILDRGCPALRRLIDALDPADDAGYTARVSALIRRRVLETHGGRTIGPDGAPLSGMSDLWIHGEEAPEERARKIRELRRWWKEEGAARHPAWRFWSGGCGTPVPGF
jgi:hypothetical protein